MYTHLTLSGVRFTLISKDEPLLAQVEGTKEIWGPWLLVTDGINKRDLFVGAGFDWSKIDTAVPQDFWHWQNDRYQRSGWEHHHPKNYVRNYAAKSLFGEPLHVNDAWGSLKVRLATQLEKDYLEGLTIKHSAKP